MKSLITTCLSFPGLLLLVGSLYEIFLLLTQTKQFRIRRPLIWRFISWAIRPILVWSVFNLVYRLFGKYGFNNRLTFPFYMNPWSQSGRFSDGCAFMMQAPGELALWLVMVFAFAAAIIIALHRTLEKKGGRLWVILLILLVCTFGLHVSQASLPLGLYPKVPSSSSFLSSWNAPGDTMLYNMPVIKSSRHFMRHFCRLQPTLTTSIHGVSHPPLASLSLYWLGQAAGVGDKNWRTQEVRLRYGIGLTIFASLNCLVVFWLGQSLFSVKTGFYAAVLWTTSPLSSGYSTFAQDFVYSVFFNLALVLSWKVATEKQMRRLACWSALLGIVFFVMVFMNFSWCLVTSIFVLLVFGIGKMRGETYARLARRTVPPLAVMTLLSVFLLLHYNLNYLQMYETASEFVAQFYRFDSAYQTIMALLGGQIDLWLMTGSVVCSAFMVVFMKTFQRETWADPASRERAFFLVVLLGIFVLPLLFGPSPLKIEASRCWNWVATLPFVLVAEYLLRSKSKLFIYGTPIVSISTYTILRLFMAVAA